VPYPQRLKHNALLFSDKLCGGHLRAVHCRRGMLLNEMKEKKRERQEEEKRRRRKKE
jgi:hypothetical protein